MSHADRRYTYLRVLFRTASSSQTANYKHKTWLHACTVSLHMRASRIFCHLCRNGPRV